MTIAPDRDLVNRFATDLDELVDPAGRVGIAVSGGPDSLALLLLAAAARPGLVEAATVDHRLRPDSAAEAEVVAQICDRLAIRHAILRVEEEAPQSNLQAWARKVRYGCLGGWALERDLDAVVTAHHLDDQAETLLMRIARGSGLGGLAGVQRSRPLTERTRLVRPLLGWRRSDLRSIVDKAGLEPVDDPSNSDERFDRSRARALLDDAAWLDPRRLAAVADNLADAERALDWIVSKELEQRRAGDGSEWVFDASNLPRELRRRLLLEGIEMLTKQSPPGPKLNTALDTLDAGGTTTLAGLKLEGGAIWRLSPAPPRTSRARK